MLGFIIKFGGRAVSKRSKGRRGVPAAKRLPVNGGTWFMCVYVCVLVTQPCPTVCDPMDCSPLGSSAHRIFQARMHLAHKE